MKVSVLWSYQSGKAIINHEDEANRFIENGRALPDDMVSNYRRQ
jgi:hypothetical protein